MNDGECAFMKLGIVDTMFSRVNMGEIAIDEVKRNYPGVEIERRTVPGVKDLVVECKSLLEGGCDSCLSLGMVGGARIDTQCAHEASLSTQQAKVLTGKHIIEVFVHENEAWSAQEFREICENRVRKHAHNAVLLVTNPSALVEQAGMGVRQGKENEGPVKNSGKIRIALLVAEFNGDITSRMEASAREAAENGGAEAGRMSVPGVYDMPLAAMKLLMDKKVDAVVALGAVIKGGTAHDEVIAKDAARRLGELSLEYKKPVALGIIGHGADYESAEQRAQEYGERAALAAIKMVKVLRG